jgi:agmatine deiminase
MALLTADQFDFTGYRMPAEWAKHEATWLVWPSNSETWPSGLEPVQAIWIEMMAVLSQGERVYLLVKDCETLENVQTLLAKRKDAVTANIEILLVPNNDSWVRDSGPIFCLNPSRPDAPRIANDFIFNSWGKKYGPWDDDDVIPRKAGDVVKCPVIIHDLVLEGGSIDPNGCGTLLTTTQCLLNKNRNPHLSKTEIEDRLKKFLGLSKIIWLGDGIEGDDTDGHVDDISRFVNPTTVVTVFEEDSTDPNYGPLKENFEHLKKETDQDGNPLRVITLPMPDRVEGPFGRSPASYGNFYIANHAVLVPVYSSKNDQVALDILQKEFPDRKVVGIECTPLVRGLGAIHCVTQQQPAVV